MAKENTGTDNFSELSAPPGFPIRAYANQNHTLCPESSSVRDHEVLQKVNEEALLGKEGARIWKQHFAPKPNSDNIIQDSQEHVVETSEDKCASESMSASSTSALHKNKKRKDNIPMVETEVPDKEIPGGLPSKRSKKGKGEGQEMEGGKGTKEKNKKWL
ncbi:uncharacterized protein LOC125525178 isoform X2 [Triticum urartu]|uniref:uncharacterized protein LOC125525178 isoform X2 n=1 Tax=Triticum urartu TaxID=4572 RepID=UPI0020434CF0|nr:uncharacterized protein LOC125525178 isoform X2 [Triticum urartu]